MVRAEPPMLPAMGRRFAITVKCSQTCMLASQHPVTTLLHTLLSPLVLGLS